MSSRVSPIISTPDLMINPEITAPTQASREMPVARKIRADPKTEADRTASKVASEPEAIREPELTFFPCALT